MDQSSQFTKVNKTECLVHTMLQKAEFWALVTYDDQIIEPYLAWWDRLVRTTCKGNYVKCKTQSHFCWMNHVLQIQVLSSFQIISLTHVSLMHKLLLRHTVLTWKSVPSMVKTQFFLLNPDKFQDLNQGFPTLATSICVDFNTRNSSVSMEEWSLVKARESA